MSQRLETVLAYGVVITPPDDGTYWLDEREGAERLDRLGFSYLRVLHTGSDGTGSFALVLTESYHRFGEDDLGWNSVRLHATYCSVHDQMLLNGGQAIGVKEWLSAPEWLIGVSYC
jgi:hypothetical protein